MLSVNSKNVIIACLLWAQPTHKAARLVHSNVLELSAFIDLSRLVSRFVAIMHIIILSGWHFMSVCFCAKYMQIFWSVFFFTIFTKPQSFRRCDESFTSNFYIVNCKHISILHAQLYTDFLGQLRVLWFSTCPQTKTSLCCFISSPDRVCLNIQNTIFRLRMMRRAAWLESRWSWSHASMWLRATALPECSLTSDCLEASFALWAMLTCKQNVLTRVFLTFE